MGGDDQFSKYDPEGKNKDKPLMIRATAHVDRNERSAGMLSKSQMSELLERLVETGNELKRYFDAEDDLGVLGGPASEHALSALKQKFGDRLPKSYLQFGS